MNAKKRTAPRPQTPGLVRKQLADRNVKPDDSRSGHVAEAAIRLNSVEAGLARIVLDLEPASTLTTYIELVRIARLHLAAVA